MFFDIKKVSHNNAISLFFPKHVLDNVENEKCKFSKSPKSNPPPPP